MKLYSNKYSLREAIDYLTEFYDKKKLREFEIWLQKQVIYSSGEGKRHKDLILKSEFEKFLGGVPK